MCSVTLFVCSLNYVVYIGETYLLFANSHHINRVSVNGSSFEILYSEQFSGGIVALDYDYR